MKKKLNYSALKSFLLILVVSIVFSYSIFGQNVSYFLKTSIIGYPEHEPFDGTVYPIEKVPDWVNLDSDRWDDDYSSLSDSDLVEIPYYDPNQLIISTDDLTWGDSEDNKIRNAKIIYSVPYMGNYLLDGKEYSGSHLAVDIKVPSGTPIKSIANGTVIKASEQSSGFGYHIVLQHNNFPTLDDPDAKEIIYSSYSHLSEVSVSEGDTVLKGEQIGLSGATGTATTPHLHFQIDNDDAPWHPFWPFTWQEASDAGLDFFSAVNEGLGQDKAIDTTINPMKYVQEYLDASAFNTNNSGSETNDGADADSYVPEDNDTSNEVDANNTVESNETPEDISEETSEEVTEEVVEETAYVDPPVLTFEFEVSPQYYIDGDSDFSILLRDQYGDVFEVFLGEALVSSSNGLITSSPAIIRSLDFDKNGRLNLHFSKMEEGRDKLKIDYNGTTYYSDWFELVSTDDGTSFSDVSKDNEYFEAITYLAGEKVVAGYPDGTFKPNNTVSRVEALKFIFEGIKETISSGNIPFSDVSNSEWYGDYLYTAYSEGVVSGYPDGTFKPSNKVNKAEFYKILFNSMKIDINFKIESAPFEDVKVGDWFAPYLAYAKEIGIIDPSLEKISPSKDMTRGEVADAIYKLMLVMK